MLPPMMEHDLMLNSPGQHITWFPDQQLPKVRINELMEKCEKLIKQYEDLSKKNAELKEEIASKEKEKLILNQPQAFPVEYQKILISIETYKAALIELEKDATLVMPYINHET